MAKFEDFLNAFRRGAKDLAENTFDGFEDEIQDDTEAFIEKFKKDLRRWTKQLAKGDLSEQDFKDLVKAKKALAEINALRKAGVTLTKLERFRTGLIDLVIDTAIDTFL